MLDEAFAFLEEGATRVAKDENGETKIVDGNMTYYEWLKEQDPKFVEDVIGKKRAELLLSDKISAEEFRKLQMDKNFRPMTLKEMREKEPEIFERIEKKNLDSDKENIILLQREQEAISQVKAKIDSATEGASWRITASDLSNHDNVRYGKENVEKVALEFAETIRHSPYEISLTVDRAGRFVEARSSGQTDTVDITGMDVKNNINIHNHPLGTLKFNTVDIKALVRGEMYESIIITPNGEYLSLTRTEWQPMFRNLLDVARINYGKKANVEIDWLNANAANYGYLFERGRI